MGPRGRATRRRGQQGRQGQQGRRSAASSRKSAVTTNGDHVCQGVRVGGAPCRGGSAATAKQSAGGRSPLPGRERSDRETERGWAEPPAGEGAQRPRNSAHA